jgi:hypothetical protein
MNFPLEYPLMQFFYWLLNTSGYGGIAVMIVGGGSVLAYLVIVRWIAAGAKSGESDAYAYPTPSLHDHDE